LTDHERWRRLWNEIDGALVEFSRAQAIFTERFLKDVRLAVEGYGLALGLDPEVLAELRDIEEEG